MYNQFDLLGDGDQTPPVVNGLKLPNDTLKAFTTATAPSDPDFSQISSQGAHVCGNVRSTMQLDDVSSQNTSQIDSCCEDACDNCAWALLIRWYKAATQYMFESSHKNIVHDLIYWRNPVQSGFCLTLSLFLIIALKYWSTLAVFSFSCLTLMTLSGFYKLASILSTSIVGHSLPKLPGVLSAHWKIDNTSNQTVEQKIKQVNMFLHWLQAVLLWEQIIQSVLVMVFAFLAFHVGRSFDTLTIAMLKLIFFFTVPYIYSRNQHHIQVALDRIRTVTTNSKNTLLQKIRSLSGSSGSKEHHKES